MPSFWKKKNKPDHQFKKKFFLTQETSNELFHREVQHWTKKL